MIRKARVSGCHASNVIAVSLMTESEQTICSNIAPRYWYNPTLTASVPPVRGLSR